jgi:dihydroneopterin aldolase
MKLQAHAESAGRLTVEALAEDLAKICLETPGVQKVRLRVEKPGALRFAKSAGVEIERGL